MKITVSSIKNNSVTIELIGQMWENHDLIVFREKIDELCCLGIKRLYLDLSSLSFISNQGLGILVNAFSEIKNNDGELSIYKPQASIMELLDLCGLTSYMKIIVESDKAIEAR